MIGQVVSHYRVVEKLGGGGMGVVYRAEDTKLLRSVALKFLPPELTRDEDTKLRFVREAQAASALDHPNICTVHEIDETPDGQLFIAMAYYPGETLKKKIERGPLKLDEALDYAMQIAQGLVKAHAAAIVHRDIKPANVMVTSDGLVKIVDFGLAKLLGQTGVTRTGTTLGTVAYMSPEQTKALEVDARSDLWSLGVVFYEMIAGRLPFAGTDTFAVANAIVHDTPPPLTSLRTGVPMELDRVVNRALAKQPEDRYQTAADFLSEVRRLKRESDGQPSLAAATVRSVPARERGWQAATWTAGVVLVVGGIVGYWSLPSSRQPTAAMVRLANPLQVAASLGAEQSPSWSPDGRLLAYDSDQAGNPDVWVTQMGGGPPVNRTADYSGFDGLARWSPDGHQFAFWSDREGGGIFVMPALAGGAHKIAPADPSGDWTSAAWSPDGLELAYPVADAGRHWLERRALRNGTTRRLILPGRTGNIRLDLSWSPDGQFLAYVDAINSTAQVTQLWVLRLSDGKAIPLTDGRTCEWSPSWSADSHTLFFVSNRGGPRDLWQQRITTDGGSDGAAERLSTGLELLQAAVSPDGRRVAYSKGRLVANAWRVPILADRAATWSDAQQLTFDHAEVESLDVSRDGQKLVVSSDRDGNLDLWLLPASGGDMQPLTTDPTPDWFPAWSPDGREIAFYAYRSGTRQIWIQPISGGPARQLTRGEREAVYPRWSPDGKAILFSSYKAGAGSSWTVPAAGGEPHPIVIEPTNNERPEWSPDGRWLAFASGFGENASIWRVPATGGQAQRMTRPLGGPPPGTGGNDGCPRWAPDGQRIFFMSFRKNASNLWSVSPDGKSERSITNLVGKAGNLFASIATDGRYLYFTWLEDLASDIWVMDVVPAGR